MMLLKMGLAAMARRSALVLTGSAMLLGSAHVGAAARPGNSIPVVCKVQPQAKSPIRPLAACEAIRAAVATSLRRPAHLVEAIPGQGDYLHFAVRSPRRNAIEIGARGRLGGRATAGGPLVLDVMDRQLVPSDVNRLAARVAETLAGRR